MESDQELQEQRVEKWILWLVRKSQMGWALSSNELAFLYDWDFALWDNSIQDPTQRWKEILSKTWRINMLFGTSQLVPEITQEAVPSHFSASFANSSRAGPSSQRLRAPPISRKTDLKNIIVH